MEMKEFIATLKTLKGKDPATVAMTFLSTPQGAKFMTGLLKTKEQMDKGLRRAWDFLGMPSYSDQEKVDRAIGRVGTRIRDVEKDLEELDRTLSKLEASLDNIEEPVSVPEKEMIAEEPPAEIPTAAVSAKSSLLLFRPEQVFERRQAKNVPVSKTIKKPPKNAGKANQARPIGKPVSLKTKTAPKKPEKNKRTTPASKPVLARNPLLDLRFKK